MRKIQNSENEVQGVVKPCTSFLFVWVVVIDLVIVNV